MTKKRTPKTTDKLESVTKTLLECFEELSLIYRVLPDFILSLDIKKIQSLILSEAMEALEADMGWLVPCRENGDQIKPLRKDIDKRTASVINSFVVNELLKTGKSKEYYNLGAELGLSEDTIPGPFLCSLLKTEKKVYGALCIGRKNSEKYFTAGDLKLANLLTTSAALAIENFELHKSKLEEEQALTRIREEMRLARDIQMNLFPKDSPRIAGYDIAGKSIPAKSVGGDYYDYFPLDGQKTAVCLGDISGKGLPAALLMSNLQATIRGQSAACGLPKDCIHRTNHFLYRSTDTDKFATLFYGILYPEINEFCYSNAGHNPPLFLNIRGEAQLLKTGGPVIGFMEDVTFTNDTVIFEPGSVCVLYSDGVTEAMDKKEREFGEERLEASIRNNMNLTAAGIIDKIIEDVNEYSTGPEQSDDITMVVIKKVQG